MAVQRVSKTELLDILRQQGRDQLIVCGIYAHIGCLMTACEAFMQDVQPFFVADAVADFSADKHRMALAYAAERCAVTITTRRLVEDLARLGSRRLFLNPLRRLSRAFRPSAKESPCH